MHSKVPPRLKKASASDDILREHQRLTFHVENSPLAAIEYDHEFRIRRWSRQAEKLFGWKSREVLGKHNFELRLVHPSDESKVELAINKLIERRQPRNVLRNRNYRKNGSIMLCEWYNSALLDEKGQVASILSLAQDVSHQERSFMERSIAMVSEKERQRIGLELHDVLAQQLAGLAFLSRAFEMKLATRLPEFAAQAAQLAQLASEAVLQVRNLSSGLYPAELERRGLVGALRELALSQSQLYRRPCSFKQTGTAPALDSAVSLNLFRIVQEAVTNSMKHSRASQVAIQFHATKKELFLTVSDDGIGVPTPAPDANGKGIRIMNYRAESIGAHLQIEATKPRGTTVTCIVPLKLVSVP
ncbi:MAG TPA: PAS domain-containing sensor histidine kinase [Candidatus Methylacidiphilales bacterium]